MRPDAVFWIASQSKPITATAFMMLVDEGKVSLDDPVEKYLPEFKGQMLSAEEGGRKTLRAPRHPITVREVLSHTSGLPFKSAKEPGPLDKLPLRDAVQSYAEAPLQSEPGAKYQYSNAGINTAGRIIEVVSGVPYEEFLRQRLFDPLGMKDTTFWPGEQQVARLAKSYKPNAAKTDLEETTVTQLTYPLSDRGRRYPMPAGGLFSTADDLARFCRMVLNGGSLDGKRYLSERAVREMTAKQTGDLKENYGLGWATGGGTFGHGGAYSTNMTVDPRRGLVLIYLVQHSGFPNDGAKALGAFQAATRAR
jgi:CubicO group peptidase (beta-lactamase class C family)